MKQLLDYITAIHPINDTQRAHIEFLVKAIIENAGQAQYDKGYKEGHAQGLKHGRVEGKMLASGMSDEELEDFYKQQEEE